MTQLLDEHARRRQQERAEANLLILERIVEQDWPHFRASILGTTGNLDLRLRALTSTIEASESARPGRQRVHDIWMAAISALLLALLFERLAARLFPRNDRL